MVFETRNEDLGGEVEIGGACVACVRGEILA